MSDSQREVSREDRRSTAEWISLSVSSAIVLALVGVIVFLYVTGGTEGPVIEARPEFTQVRQGSGDYYLPLTIVNSGSSTAEDVIVEVSFTPSQGPQEVSEVTIAFLPGSAQEDAAVVFSGDPREGDVSVDVISYVVP